MILPPALDSGALRLAGIAMARIPARAIPIRHRTGQGSPSACSQKGRSKQPRLLACQANLRHVPGGLHPAKMRELG